MSYSSSLSLQEALFSRLETALDVPVFDAMPEGALPSTYITIGLEDARARGDTGGCVSTHELKVGIVTDQPGFASAKAVARTVSETLIGADLALSRGHLVSLGLRHVRASRIASGRMRRVEMNFHAIVDDPTPSQQESQT